MLARLQQCTTLGALALALLWAAVCLRAGHAAWAVAGVLLLLGGYALVLAIEFTLLHRVHGNDPTPRATPAQLLAAWWGEVRSAPIVFCWRQPFRSRVWPDNLPAAATGRRGVVLVHGFVCNRGLWNPWLARLHAQGTPFVAVNLEPVFGSIDQTLATLERAVQQMVQSTGLPPVMVAHSMGGLAVRRWQQAHGGSGRVHHVLTIGSPHHGTWLARFAFSRNGQEMRQASPWLQNLRQLEAMPSYSGFTCFYGHCDNIVFPPAMATLPGADNRHLPGVAHVHMVDSPEPFAELQRLLTP